MLQCSSVVSLFTLEAQLQDRHTERQAQRMAAFRGRVCFLMPLPTKNAKHTKKVANAVLNWDMFWKEITKNRKSQIK